jgi:hypothetical protein
LKVTGKKDLVRVERLHLKILSDTKRNMYDNKGRNRGVEMVSMCDVELKCVKDNGIYPVNYEDEHVSYFL